MSIILDDPIFLHECQSYLVKQGYLELLNVYLFTAPFDALNWKVMYAPKFKDVDFDNWSDVIGLNETAKNIHSKFLIEYAHIRKMTMNNELDRDPFLFSSAATIDSSIFYSDPPRSIRKKVMGVRSYFEN